MDIKVTATRSMHWVNTRQDADADADGYYNLGDHYMPISTKSTEAQKWFNRGLVWVYGFNHEEAVKCFRRALDHDADCAMALWGVAYALGPNYNKTWGVFDPLELETSTREARQSIVKALEKSGPGSGVSDVERALIVALERRHPRETISVEDGYLLNKEYAEAMRMVYQSHPEHPDVTAIYVDALMNLSPWRLWDIRTGEPLPEGHALEAKKALDDSLKKHPRHPGMLHLYIHLMEMSTHPEEALHAADTLRALVPDAGHLNHMPTHIDVLCGDYRLAISSNTDAIVADEKFVARDGALNFYSLYRCHNYHFRVYAAMFAGQSRVALQTVDLLERTLSEDLLRTESPPMADWLEGFLSLRVHVLIRFGLWHDLIGLKLPDDQDLYCNTTAMIHYGKGVAFANVGMIKEAEESRRLFHEAVKKVPESRTIFNNTCLSILAIASTMLDGELEYRKGNIEEGLAHLRHAITLDDNLPYDEPWGWMQPTRHAYGALLLEQGRLKEALAVYAADLGFDESLPRALQHRNNVWALHGFHECLLRLNREEEARLIRPQLQLAIAAADVPVNASCFCRRVPQAACDL